MTDFAKYQALGNDYIVVDPNHVALTPTPHAIRLLCDRHVGIGADGVLLGPVGPVEPGRPIMLRIFNSDGGECERSGNGLRIFTLYLAEHHRSDTEFVVRTVAGDCRTRLLAPDAGIVSVEMGTPRFDAADIPLQGVQGSVIGRPLVVDGRRLLVTCVNNGNPHTVVPIDELSMAMVIELGPQISSHERFPNGTNVQFMRVIDRTTVQIEIWERGAGYTLASGSSSCAAATAAHVLGMVDGHVTVRMPGGQIDVRIADDGAVTMTGAAEKVMVGRFSPALRAKLGPRYGPTEVDTSEADTSELIGAETAR